MSAKKTQSRCSIRQVCYDTYGNIENDAEHAMYARLPSALYDEVSDVAYV